MQDVFILSVPVVCCLAVLIVCCRVRGSYTSGHEEFDLGYNIV
jgi:hypothetical protein